MSTPREFTKRDRELLGDHLSFYRELDSGTRAPATPAQRQFVQVCKGGRAPRTPHEQAYIKYRDMEAWSGTQDMDLMVAKLRAWRQQEREHKQEQIRRDEAARREKAERLRAQRMERRRTARRQERQRQREEYEKARKVVESVRARGRKRTGDSEPVDPPSRPRISIPSPDPVPTRLEIPDHEDGVPIPGWATDADILKSRRRQKSDGRRGG